MQLMPPVPVDNLVAVAGKAPGILDTTAGSQGQLKPHNSRGCDPVVLWTSTPTNQWALTSTLQGMRPGAYRNGTCLHSKAATPFSAAQTMCPLPPPACHDKAQDTWHPTQPHDTHSAPTQLPSNLTKSAAGSQGVHCPDGCQAHPPLPAAVQLHVQETHMTLHDAAHTTTTARTPEHKLPGRCRHRKGRVRAGAPGTTTTGGRRLAPELKWQWLDGWKLAARPWAHMSRHTATHQRLRTGWPAAAATRRTPSHMAAGHPLFTPQDT